MSRLESLITSIKTVMKLDDGDISSRCMGLAGDGAYVTEHFHTKAEEKFGKIKSIY